MAQTLDTAPAKSRFPLAGDLICCVLLLAVCLTVALPCYRCGLDLMDEGFLAYGAERVMEGQVPNRDFVSLQPPLCFYSVAATFKLLGTSLASMRVLGLGIYLLISFLTYAITRKMAGRGASLAAAVMTAFLGLPYFNFVPFAVWQGVAATMAAAFFYLTSMRRGSDPRLAAAAGVMTAAAFLARQDQAMYGAVSIAAGTLVLKGERWRNFRWWLIGLVAALLPWVLYWVVSGALPEIVRQLILFPLTTYAKTSSKPFPPFNSQWSLGENAVTGLFYLPPPLGACAAIWLWRQKRRGIWDWREGGVAFVLIWSLLYYLQVLVRSDVYHLLPALAPVFILCGCLWCALLEEMRGVVRRRTFSAIAAAVAVWFLWSTRTVFLTGTAGEDLDLPRGGVRLAGGADLASFIKVVQSVAPAGRSILCLPYQPMFYFLAERRDPTRWNYIWPGDQSAEDHAELVRQARKDPPAAVVLSDETALAGYAPVIVAYVHADFKKYAKAGGYAIYLPK